MKITKRVLTIVLSLALVIGGLNFVAQDKTKAAIDFAITAPINGQMKAAGAFDITWEDASDTKPVRSYDVFIDGSLVKNTTDTTYEFYTVKVYFHKVWVRANFEDGTDLYTRTVRFGVTKKGLAINDNMGRYVDPIDLQIGWYYNWGLNPFATSFDGGKYNNIEYVPMIWGDTSPTLLKSRVENAASRGYKYILGFNEPDIPKGSQGGSQMSIDRVVELWPNFLDNNIKVGSPAYSLGGLDPDDPEKASKMFPGFMGRVENRVDHICIHAYPDNWNGGTAMATWLLDDICKKQYNKYHKPVWITEYSTSGNGITQAGTSSFIRSFNARVNSDEYDFIERHSFFSFDSATFNGGLWNHSTGELSQSGIAYRDYGNPEEEYKTGDYVNPRDDDDPGEGFGPYMDIPQEGWADFGIYGAYTGTWDGNNTAEAALDPYDPTHIKVRKTDDNYNNAWLTQVKVTLPNLDPNEEYTYEWPITATNDKGSIKSSNGTEGDTHITDLTEGYQVITGIPEVKDGVVNITIGMGAVDNTNAIEFHYPTVKDKDGNVVYPKETPTTMAPTTRKPTTKAPTTQAPTTPAPTVKPTVEPSVKPSVKPTTKKSVKVKKPGKAKIKKAKYKKKRKISIKLKKVKGAKGYQIRYSDVKNFDGYWQKNTKKTKITLKKLDKNTKYYIKARAYKLVNGAKLYGKWSKKKKVKVKK
ncbi:MAG: hypothetical protein K6E58_04155 [Eubacterium sp.]|nr:hypothetical protein [Eubacterium sp.]